MATYLTTFPREIRLKFWHRKLHHILHGQAKTFVTWASIWGAFSCKFFPEKTGRIHKKKGGVCKPVRGGCGFFCLQLEASCSQWSFLPTIDNFSFLTCNWSFFALNFSFFTDSWSFFLLTVGKCVQYRP